jgi:Secretion system C-terminal sorting domain
MKNKLLIASITFLFAITLQANNFPNKTKFSNPLSYCVNPFASISGNTTICPGNTAIISIVGTSTSVVSIKNLNTNEIYTAPINANGTGSFITPQLNATTTFSLVSVTEFFTNLTTTYTGITVVITVVPNGCVAVNTNGNLGIDAVNNTPICTVGECRTLIASPTAVPSTTTYEISSIPYCPQAAFQNPTWIQLYPGQIQGDDQWSFPFNFPGSNGTVPNFKFCFFGNSYSSINVGTNGVITFNPQVGGSYCNWPFTQTIPNPTFPIRNAIYGVYQDTDFSVVPTLPAQLTTNYQVIGTYPCRKFIVNFTNLPQFACGNSVGLQTSQIVLYEVSNIIEIYIQNRTPCNTWQNGVGVIGIQNTNGTLGYAPPGRNTGNWSAVNEAWRFTPNGPAVPLTFQWLENGIPISNNITTTVCPTQTTSYVAQANYNVCGEAVTINSNPIDLFVILDQTQNPNNIEVCYDSLQTYTVDLTQNNSTILGGLSPNNYDISYFPTLVDAQQFSNPIPNPSIYSFTQSETLYAGISDVLFGCIHAKPFQINISPTVAAPSGVSPQYFAAGQTLNNIIITGSNITWYDAAQGGNQLPGTTLIQDGTTYYASQTINNCEGRNFNSNRLAITTFLTLNNPIFEIENIVIQPNPFENIISVSSIDTLTQIELFNTIGQKIMVRKLNPNEIIVDLSELSSGVYLLKAFANEKTRTFKIIKK